MWKKSAVLTTWLESGEATKQKTWLRVQFSRKPLIAGPHTVSIKSFNALPNNLHYYASYPTRPFPPPDVGETAVKANMINTIVTGDCLNAMKQIQPQSVKLIVTSPPYPGQKNDNRTVTEWLQWFDNVADLMYGALADDGIAVVNVQFKRKEDGYADERLYTDFLPLMRDCGFNLLDFYPFIKANPAPNGANGDSVYTDIPSWEPAFVFSKATQARDIYFEPVRRPYAPKTFTSKGRMKSGRAKHANINPDGARQGNYLVLSTSGNSRSCAGYPRAEGQSFPPDFAERFIRQYTKVGDLVLDPFCGVGTTCRVAQINGRDFIGIELLDREAAKAREWLSRAFQRHIAMVECL